MRVLSSPLQIIASILVTIICAFYYFNKPPKQTSDYQPRQSLSKDVIQSTAGSEYSGFLRSNVKTGQVEESDLIEARSAIKQFDARKSEGLGIQWTEMGPTNQGGRTRALIIDNQNANMLYAGCVSGGVFITTDAGGHWSPIDDHMENLNVSSMAQSVNGDLYVGTGSQFDGYNGTESSGFLGTGIYRYQNGGEMNLLNETDPSAQNDNSLDWVAVNALACDPTKEERIYAATNKGLRVSNDYGESWQHVIYADCPSIQFPILGSAQDVEVDERGVVLAVINGAIYRSESGEECSFELISDGFPVSNISRTEVKFAPSNNDYAYAVTVASGALEGVYQSTNNGLSWNKVQDKMEGYFMPMGQNNQGYYDLALGVSSTNENSILIGGVEQWRWDGNLTRVSAEFAAEVQGQFNLVVHSDKHAFVFHPTNSDIYYIASDGGIAKTYDGGQNFLTMNFGYNTTQFYSVAFDNDDKMMGGTQDNGTLEISNESNSGESVLGGDGFDCAYSNISDVVFASLYYQDLQRGVEGQSMSTVSSPYHNGSTGNFYTTFSLWETPEDIYSQDSIQLELAQIKQGIVTGNGITKHFTKSIVMPDNVAQLVPGSVSIEVGTQVLSDDLTGVLSGNGSGTVNYAAQSIDFTLIDAPGENMTVWIYFDYKYDAGSIVTMASSSRNLPVEVVLSVDLLPGDILKVQDPIQSLLALGVEDPNDANKHKIVITRGALDLSVNPTWIEVTEGSNYTTEAHCMTFSKDGDHLFVGTGGRYAGSGKVYRISGLSQLYDEEDMSNISVTKIGTFDGVVTGIATDPGNNENIVVTLGNYGRSNDYVWRHTSAVSSTEYSSGTGEFEGIQGDLVSMPIFDAMIDMYDPNIVLLATEFGVYGTDGAFTNFVNWTNENTSLANVPVYAIEQQTGSWDITGNVGQVYLATHGRGLWKSGSLVSSVEDGFPVVSSKETDLIEISAYPMPNSGEFILEIPCEAAQLVSISIVDMNGRLINEFSGIRLKKGLNQESINIGQVQKGNYFIQVRGENFAANTKLMVVN